MKKKFLLMGTDVRQQYLKEMLEQQGHHTEWIQTLTPVDAAEYDAVLLPVAAAVMANGDAAVVVAAGVLLLDLDQGLLRGGMLVDPIKAGNGHVPAGGGHRTVGFNRHSLSLP